MSQEIERLSSLLKSKNEELETLKKQFKEYEYSVNQKFEGEIKTTLIQYENHINGLTKETEDLRRKLQEAGDLNRKLVEYENKIVLLSQEMERLNVIVTNKIEENQKLGAQNE
jgi:regulator of replication initiation timing